MAQAERTELITSMRQNGATFRDIRKATGLANSTIARYLKRAGLVKPNKSGLGRSRAMLNASSVMAFIKANGLDERYSSETWSRTLWRWKHETDGASFWTLDKFCCEHGLHIDDFLRFCQRRNLPVWLNGVPDWEKV
jgi:hypothetical protein